MTQSLLQAFNVSKGFPGVKALDEMSLDLRYGEVLALVGENGAGKSTLMKLLSGVYAPEVGEFRLHGRPYRPAGPKQALTSGVSIIHQEFNLMPHLTVAQNIFIGREPRIGPFTPERALERRTTELLNQLGIDLNPRELVGGLTVAKQQMVEIAKALSHRPQVLIMDEPTAALNDAEVATLHALIRRFRSQQTGVIYISHRMDELQQISDRITVIRDGRFIKTLDTDRTDMSEVVALMVGRELNTDAVPVDVRDDRDVVLEVRDLGTKELLRDVSFDLHRGEILGFAGLMGSGRTEVARAIVGADRRTGLIRLNGQVVGLRSPAEAAKRGIGYLSEDRKNLGLLLDQDLGSNIALPSFRNQFSTAGWVHQSRIRANSTELVEQLKVKTPSIRQRAKNLSGGNQQKVVIAKWLAKDCDILIFDEPTRGIDVGAKAEIYDLLNALAAAGKSIIMISSELPEVLRMSHRVLVMSQGRVSGLLQASEATQEAVMHLATRRTDTDPHPQPTPGPTRPKESQ